MTNPKFYFDSRERKNDHIKDYFDRHGIEWEVKALSCGDYQLADNPNLVIERKMSLEEISRNLLNAKDSSRFWREVRRAHEHGIQLVVLIESGRTVKTINEVVKWKSHYSPVTGRRLIDEMIRCEMAYGVQWAFCDRRSTARRIIEILSEGGDGK